MRSPEQERITEREHHGSRPIRSRPPVLARIGGPLCAYAVLTSLLLISLLIVSAQWDIYRGNFLIDKADWRRVQGRITHSDIVHKRRSFRPDVRYVYSVNGASFNGSKISFGYQGFPRESEALRVTSKYQVGQNVVVYCLKREPEFAVLAPFSTEPGSLATNKAVLLSIPLFVAGLLATIYVDVNARKRMRSGSNSA